MNNGFLRALALTLAACYLAAAFSAGPAAGAGGGDGAGEKADAEPDRLVEQLGDTSPSVRRSAAWRLREIGMPAIPALRKGVESDDPEVQVASRAALKAIDRPPLPEAGDGPRSSQVIRADEEQFAVDFHEGKRVVRVEGDVRKPGKPYGHLKLTFTGPVDGKGTTQTFAADSEEQLKWEAPQAWKYFHGIFNHDSDMAAVRVSHPALTAEVTAAMEKLNLPADERQRVLERLRKYDDASSRALAAQMFDPDDAPRRMADEYRESDGLRKFLAERDLPVVEGGGGLDSPPEARLGVSVSMDPADFPAAGVAVLVVKFAASGDRADRIGVRAGDVIQRINRAAVTSAAQLRPACLASPGGMVIDVYRDGKTVSLRETSDAGDSKRP